MKNKSAENVDALFVDYSMENIHFQYEVQQLEKEMATREELWKTKVTLARVEISTK